MKKIYFLFLFVFIAFLTSCSTADDSDIVSVDSVLYSNYSSDLSLVDSVNNFILVNREIIGDVLWIESEEDWCYIADTLMNLPLEDLKTWYANARYKNRIIESMLIHDSVYNNCLEQYSGLDNEDNFIAFEDEIYSAYVEEMNVSFADYVESYTKIEVDSISNELEYFDYFGPFYSYNILDWLCNDQGYFILEYKVIKRLVDGCFLIVDFVDFDLIKRMSTIQEAYAGISAGVLDENSILFNNSSSFSRGVSFSSGFSEKYGVSDDKYKLTLTLYSYGLTIGGRFWEYSSQYCTMSIYNKKKNIFGHWILSRSHTDYNLEVIVSLGSLEYEEFIFDGSAYLSTIFGMRSKRIYTNERCTSIGWDGYISNWRGLVLEY